MVWTNVAKPTSSLITRVNPQGKESYDETLLTYDDSSTYYDGINTNQWTSVSKPASTTWTNISKPS